MSRARMAAAVLAGQILAGCAALPFPEVNTLPDDYQEALRRRDRRLEALYERFHPVPGPGLHVRTIVQREGKAVEAWVYVSGAW